MRSSNTKMKGEGADLASCPLSVKQMPRPAKKKTQHQLAQSKNFSPSSLFGLSLLWLTLCTGLVYKYPPLLRVFICFCVSFGLALFLKSTTRYTGNTSTTTPQAIQHVVALLATALASGGIYTNDYGNDSLFVALSVMAGYLAFDHWWSALYCSAPPPPPRKPIAMITEDALSLSILIAVLVLIVQQESNQEEAYSRYFNLQQPEQGSRNTVFILCWLFYRFLRSIYGLVHLYMHHTPVSHSQKFKGTEKIPTVDPSKIWIIHGQAYDLQDYIDRHPGGKEAILLGQGRHDCTALFESYHPFTNQHRIILQKYRLNPGTQQRTKSRSQLLPPPKDYFYSVLCERVAHQLRTDGVDPIHDRSASWSRIVHYSVIGIAVAVSGYAHCRGSILGSWLFAVFGWLLGSLGHDAGHFAASRKAWVNDMGLYGMSLLCNPVQWQHQHTYAHHSFTNDFDHDPDVHHFTTLLRVHRRFQSHPIYRNQHYTVYVALAYTLVVFGTCVWIPLGMLREGSLYGMVEWTDRKRPLRALAMFLHLILYISVILILPFWVHRSVWSAMTAVVLHVATSGLIFAIFSQINHINEDSIRTESRKTTSSWAIEQIETSNNFCPKSHLWHFLSNGLNLQIEHHLFPGLNHCHLPKIASTVEATCREFNIEYKCQDSWSDLMRCTLSWLDRLAEEPSFQKQAL